MSTNPTSYGRVNRLHTVQPSRNICLKALVIFVVAIGAIALVTGILALLASKGIPPSSMNSLANLATIGMVNSSLMTSAGFILFVLGTIAWGCHLHKESSAEVARKRVRTHQLIK